MLSKIEFLSCFSTVGSTQWGPDGHDPYGFRLPWVASTPLLVSYVGAGHGRNLVRSAPVEFHL